LAAAHDAGGGYRDIEAAELLETPRCGGIKRRLVACIGLESGRSDTLLSAVLDHRIEQRSSRQRIAQRWIIGTDVNTRHGESVGGEPAGGGCTDAPTGSGDEGNW